MEVFKLKLTAFSKALTTLNAALKMDENDIVRDAVIQR